jgi:hypothetical protein
MTSVEQAKGILDPKKLKLPEKPHVDAIDVEDTVDLDGKDALRVQVIIAEDTTDDEITGEAVIEIKSAIRDALRSQGIAEFAFIYFAKPSELQPTDEAE